MQTMSRILRGQEQIKATQVDIKNTLAVVMHNTIPAEPELGGIKEESCRQSFAQVGEIFSSFTILFQGSKR
jgi:hypothetical protein